MTTITIMPTTVAALLPSVRPSALSYAWRSVVTGIAANDVVATGAGVATHGFAASDAAVRMDARPAGSARYGKQVAEWPRPPRGRTP